MLVEEPCRNQVYWLGDPFPGQFAAGSVEKGEGTWVWRLQCAFHGTGVWFVGEFRTSVLERGHFPFEGSAKKAYPMRLVEHEDDTTASTN